MKSVYCVAIGFGLIAGLSSCMPAEENVALEDSPSYATETALAVVNSVATDTERGTFELLASGPSCKSVNPRSACNSANQITVDWKECSAKAGNLKGGWTNTYNNANACNQSQSGALQNGQSMTRTSSGLVIDGYYGGTLTFNTLAHSTYDRTDISNRGVTVTNLGRYRSIDIESARRTLRNADGKTLFDVSITTDNQILMTGNRSSANRQVNAGVMRVYDNTEKYTAQITFQNLKWGRSTCCYPTSGSVQTTYEGSKTGTSTILFTNDCGSAKHTNEDGETKDFTLIQCE